jgi:hypothetical protein
MCGVQLHIVGEAQIPRAISMTTWPNNKGVWMFIIDM